MNKIVALLLFVFVSCQGTSSTNESDSQEDVKAFEIALSTLSGEEIDLKQHSNKIIILNLWATWCKPCIAEMPDLAKMEKQLPNNFQVLVASDEPLERQLRFIDKSELDLTFVQLKSSLEGLGVYALPTTLIMDTEGAILETMVGTREWDTPEQIGHILTYQK